MTTLPPIIYATHCGVPGKERGEWTAEEAGEPYVRLDLMSKVARKALYDVIKAEGK